MLRYRDAQLRAWSSCVLSRGAAPNSAGMEQAIRAFRWGIGSVLLVSVVLFLALTYRWPLVGDVAMMHYLVLLMQHGMAPYRDIVDAQMPGTYLLEWVAMHLFGAGVVGARLYDWSLLLVATAAMVVIALPYDPLAGWFGGALLAVIHGRDGIEQTAERDLAMAALLLAAYAFAFASVRRGRPWLVLLAGMCAGAAATLKPTVLPFGIVLLTLLCLYLRRERRPVWKTGIYGVLGLALPFAVCLAFLLQERALPDFLDDLHGMWPYYATLARKPFGRLLLHGISPLLTPVLVWLVLAVVRWKTKAQAIGWERVALWAGVLLGYVSFIAQGKGFVYQRYPLLGFLLLILGLDFCTALRQWGVLRALGAAGLIAGALVIVPISVWNLSRYDGHDLGPQSTLQADLTRLGGQRLSGHVQCLDAYSGCIHTLYRMRLAQPTGFLVDFYFWAPVQNAVTRKMRSRFWQAIQKSPPDVFVINEQVFPPSYNTYQKLQRWPQFYSYLMKNYVLISECKPTHWLRWTSHPELPTGYRIYLRKGSDGRRS